LAFILNFTKPNTVRPYLMFAPVIGFATGGTIYMDDGYDYYGTDITDKSISPVDISMLLGAGIKVPIKLGDFKIVAGIEGTLDIGLIDTYSSYEHDGSSYGLNMDYYPIEGSRNNVGLELTASIAIPLSNFKKKQVEKEPKTVIMPEKKVEESEIIKSCYTIEEINTLIDAKKNVNNKVICMNNLNFEFNKSSLDKDSKTYLNNVLVLLEKVSSMKMKISGHTDNVGTDEYNMELSKKRSSAVYDYLISNGISKDRLSFEYFGSTKPLVENNSDENRAKNRRVEFEILEK
jgi:outer membrane protein OmpA-like peptidoglycan-associated protein